MKRTELVRKTPLQATAGLQRGSALNAAPLAHDREKRANQPRRRRDTGPSRKVRDIIARRSDGWCEWRGCFLVAADVHHRKNRKAGGRKGEAAELINQPAALLHACRLHHDLVTSPVGAARTVARESGWLLLEHEDALTVPVLSRHGLVLLDNAGSYTRFAPEEGR